MTDMQEEIWATELDKTWEDKPHENATSYTRTDIHNKLAYYKEGLTYKGMFIASISMHDEQHDELAKRDKVIAEMHDNLYDKAELIAVLEGLKREHLKPPYSDITTGHNTAICAAIQKVRGI